MEDEFDLEPRALAVAEQLAGSLDEEQALFGPIRDAMFEAYNLGRRNGSPWGRLKRLNRQWSSLVKRGWLDRLTTVPGPGQTVHLMNWLGVLRMRWDTRRKGGRNVSELALYTTDELRHLYQKTSGDLIILCDGRASRAELVAEIRWRTFWARFGYGLLLSVSVVAAVAAVIGAAEGWK